MTEVLPCEFENLHYNVLRQIFLLVGNIRSAGIEQVHDSTIPNAYNTTNTPNMAPNLAIHQFVTPLTVDLQSGAALACVSKKFAKLWRDIQMRELLDMTQAVYRGGIILKVIETLSSVADYNPESNKLIYYEPMRTLVLTHDRHLDLNATMARVDAQTLPGVITARPYGYTETDCLLMALPDKVSSIPGPALVEALRGRYGDAAYNVCLRFDRRKSAFFDPAKVAESFRIHMIYAHSLAAFLHSNDDTVRSSRAKLCSPILVIEKLGLEMINDSILKCISKNITRRLPSEMFELIRRGLDNNLAPRIPRDLFSPDMLKNSIYDLTRKDVRLIPRVDDIVSCFQEFKLWHNMRTLYMQSYHRRNKHTDLPKSNYPTDISGHVFPECGDSLFKSGSSRYYHHYFLKLSRFGIFSAADTVLNVLLLPFGYRERYLASKSPQMRLVVLGQCVEYLRNTAWTNFAISHQRYISAVRHEDKDNAVTASGLRIRHSRVVFNGWTYQGVSTTSPQGRVLDAIWRRVLETKTHEQNCRFMCRVLSKTAPDIISVRPTIAVLDARREKNNLPLFSLLSNFADDRIALSILPYPRPGWRAVVPRTHADVRHFASLHIAGEDIIDYINLRFEQLVNLEEELLARKTNRQNANQHSGSRNEQPTILTFEAIEDVNTLERRYIINWAHLSHEMQFVDMPRPDEHEAEFARRTITIPAKERILSSVYGAEQASMYVSASLVGPMIDALPLFGTIQQRVFAFLGEMGENSEMFERVFQTVIRCSACVSTQPDCHCASIRSASLGEKRQRISDDEAQALLEIASDDNNDSSKKRKK
jgi:hypothetical protein